MGVKVFHKSLRILGMKIEIFEEESIKIEKFEKKSLCTPI